MQLYVLDRAKNTLATTSSFYNDKHHKELTAGASIFEFTIDKSDSAAQYMTTGNYLVFLDDRGRAWSFTILSYDETQTTKTVAAEDVSIELLNKAMDIWNTDQAYPFSYYFNLVTKDTPWTLGVNQLTDLSRKLVYTGRDTGLGRLLSILKGFDNAECQFNIKVKQNSPVEFTVDVYKSIGTVQDNIQIVYNNELNDIKKTESRAQFVTALAGVGGLVENQATTDPGLEKHIDFTDIDYKDDNFVSPKGDKFLRAVTANKTFNPGTTTYIEDFYDYDTQSTQELLNRTLTQLKERSEPQYTYDADVKVIDPTLDIGDTVTIIDHDYNPALYLQARVATLDKSYTDPPQGAITFCNYRVLNSSLSDQLRAMQNIIDQLPTSASIKVINNNIVQMIADNTELKKQVALSFESANGKSRVWFSRSSTAQEGDIAFIKNADGATEIWKFVEGAWKLDTGLATFEDVKKAASAAADAGSQAVIAGQQASAAGADAKSAGDFAAAAASQSTIETAAARSTANSAVNQANLAVSQAGFANDAADQAKSAAANAQADAANAKIQATNADTQANQAVVDASTAKADAAAAKGQAANALGQANTAINNAANALDKFNNLQVGGRNLYLDTKDINNLDLWFGNESWTKQPDKYNGLAVMQTTGDWNGLSQYIKVKTGEVYTFSVYARYTSGAGASCIYWKLNDNSESGHASAQVSIVNKWVHLSDNWQRISATTTITSDGYIRPRLEHTDNNDNPLQIAGMKLERGNVATDWSPAPEDVQQQFTNIDGELASKVNQTTYNVLAGTVDTVSTLAKQNQSTISTLATKTSVDTVSKTATTAQTLAQQNANELLNKANSTTVNTLTQRVTTAESTLSQTATKAELALTKTDVDKLGDSVASQALDIAATADGLKLKADSSTVSDLAGTVAQNSAQLGLTATKADLALTQNDVNDLDDTVNKQATQLALTATKAELQVAQTNVDNLKKTVTSNTAGMTANANALKLKADSSTVSDLDGRVTSLSGQLDVQSDLISAKVTANDVTGMLGNYATQSWSQGQISAAKNEITASVQNMTSDMATQTWTQGKLDLTADGLKTQISSVKNDLTNLAIGGRNYFSVSGFAANKYAFAGIDFYDLQLLPNTKYTVSTTNVGIPDQGYANVFVGNKGFTPDSGGNGVIVNKPRTVTTDSTGILTIAARDYSLADGKDKIQVELGAMATLWQPAPEDMATEVQFTSLEQTLNGFRTTVNNAATQTQVSQLAGQITSVVKDVAPIKNLFPDPTFEGGWLPTAEGTGWTVKYDNTNLWISNGGGAEQRVYWPNIGHVGGSYSVKMLYNSAIGGPIRVGFAPVNDADMGTQYSFSAVDSDTHWVEFTVNCTVNTAFCIWLQNAQPFRVHELYIFNSATGVATSQITQLQSDINLRVKTGDLVSQIDVNAKRILLDGASTYITNTTHIDTGVIKTAMIADAAITNGKIANAAIDNAKIANAAINSAKIADLAVGSAQIADGAISSAKIGNAAITSAKIADASILDAKIVNLDGSKIVAHSITADQLDVNAIAVGLNTYGTGWQITPMSIAFLPNVGSEHASLTLTGKGIILGDTVTGETLGEITGSPYNLKTDSWFNGFNTILKYNGADYWAVLTEESDGTTRPRLMYSRNKLAELGVYEGWTFDASINATYDLNVRGDLSAGTLHSTVGGYGVWLKRGTVGGHAGFGFLNASQKSGVYFTDDGTLYLGRDSKWYNLFDIVNKIGIA